MKLVHSHFGQVTLIVSQLQQQINFVYFAVFPSFAVIVIVVTEITASVVLP